MEQVRIKSVKQSGGTLLSGTLDKKVAEKIIILLKNKFPQDIHSIVEL